MCVILTFDREFYSQHKTAIVNQVMADSRFNSDGYTLVAVGSTEDTGTCLRSLDLGLILNTLDYHLGDNGAAERVWLHLRFATTGFRGLNGCHAFAADEWVVLHNGILRRAESHAYNVDSELIAADIRDYGVLAAIEMLQAHEAYANVFLVNVNTGAWHMIRQTVGSLHTDGKGNYSTQPVATASLVVPMNTTAEYAATINTVTYLPSYLCNDAPDIEDEEAIDLLTYCDDFDDLMEVLAETNWFDEGAPEVAWYAMTSEQRAWFANEGGMIREDADWYRKATKLG